MPLQQNVREGAERVDGGDGHGIPFRALWLERACPTLHAPHQLVRIPVHARDIVAVDLLGLLLPRVARVDVAGLGRPPSNVPPHERHMVFEAVLARNEAERGVTVGA